MKISTAIVALVATFPSSGLAQDECLSGSFEFEFDGACTPEAVVSAYEDQVYDATGSTSGTCSSSAADDLTAKLASSELTLEGLCDLVYGTQKEVPFTDAADRGTDMHFERMFYLGRTDWQEEVETIYETEDGTATSVLSHDAEQVRAFYRGIAQGRRVEWPGELPNFQSSSTDGSGLPTCTTNAAMCCWPKDRQANDGNGNCATPYDQNCVDKDPADNTNLCFVDPDRGSASTGYSGDGGFIGFPFDNNDGEGSIHCHGLAWSNDVNHHTARYKANNMFFVSMYDHMYQRGYVKNIPGAPMCACVEQMPTVSRSDCTQVDLTETVKIIYHADSGEFSAKLTYVDIDFNACRGINNQNNNLWAYMARLYYEGHVTPEQFGELGRIITNHDCVEAVGYHLNTLDMARGYDHYVANYTKVAGRDALYDGSPYGLTAFNTAFWEESLTSPTSYAVTQFPVGETPIIMRICPSCADTHKKVWYRRKTPLTHADFNLLYHIMYTRNDGDGENKWGEDFSLHSSYEDAYLGINEWKCPNDSFNYGAPFDGECSPDGTRVQNQFSVFNWYPGPQPDVAYYVNKPEDAGIQEINEKRSDRSLPSYTYANLGNPSIPGRPFETTDGALIISGSGWDIWGHSDMGSFFSEQMSGDVDVKVHISSFTFIVDVYAKAGIMLRSDNSNNAAHVFGLLSGAKGIALTARRSKGYHTIRTMDWYQTNPIQKSAWIRLSKRREVVEMYHSNDGVEWILYHSVEVRFPDDTFRVGLAVTSHHDHYASEATFEDYSVETFYYPTYSPTTSSAPTAWVPGVQIGAGTKGSHTYDPNTGNTVTKGYGTGIWGGSDSFFFNNEQKATSDAIDIVAYVEKFHTGYAQAKGGIMIRASDAPDAPNAFIGMKGHYNGVTFQARGSAGGYTDHYQTTYVVDHNAWIRLFKPENSGVVTAYYKINPFLEGEWTEIGSAQVAFDSPVVLVGTAVTPGETNHWASAELRTTGFEIVEHQPTTQVLQAQKIRIELKGSNYLTLAEVEVYEEGSGANIARNENATAMQSSDYHQFFASLAINGKFSSSQVHDFSHTQEDQGAWWELDLGQQHSLTDVIVHSRKDCCLDRSNDSVIYLKDGNDVITGVYNIDVMPTRLALHAADFSIPTN